MTERSHGHVRLGHVGPRRRTAALVLPVAVVVLLGGAGACRRKASPSTEALPDAGASFQEQAPVAAPAPPPCARVPGSFADVAERLAPSLVTVLGSEAADSSPREALPLLPGGAALAPPPEAPEDEERVPLGTGFVVDGQALVVTSAQVAGDAPGLWVRLADGRTVEAAPRGVDPDLDLAVLVLEQPLRDAAPLPDAARLRPGDWVAVLAEPFGTGPTVTVGVVRALPRARPEGDEEPAVERFLAVDAAVDAANRGGPVVDAAARLVGMAVSAPGAGTRMGLVLPAAELRRATASLVETGQASRAWIGLWVRPVEAELARDLGLRPPRGLLATRVVEGGPADVAGIRPGDVVVEFSGEAVSTPARLGTLAARAPAGQQVPVVVLREGRTESLMLRPAPMPQ